MRFSRITLAAMALTGAAIVVSPGCRDASQVTLEISLAKRALCTETNGTAITVGVDAVETEERVKREYVTATTSSCDAATQSIGTLVLTPSDAGHASVIVVVAYGGISPASCKPPFYKGCVVARRQFAFGDHKQLRMPITIDPNCKDVPCDAFSTCRTGSCFTAAVAPCEGDGCLEPGATPDGGTNEAGAVIPDAGGDGPLGPGDDSGLEGGGNDGGMDAGDATDDADGSLPPPVPYCAPGMVLHCRTAAMPDVACGTSANSCCDDTLLAQCNPPVCNTPRYCCSNADCLSGKCTGANPTMPGRCTPSGGAGVSCSAGILSCPTGKGGASATCTPGTSVACCEEMDGMPYCSTVPACPVKPSIRYCCQPSDCGPGELCPLNADPNAASRCNKGIP